MWTNGLSGSWHAPANWSLGAVPVFTNSFVLISNFNSKTITADASTPATNLYLRNLAIGALQNRQNTLVLTNLVAPFDITRGFTISSGGELQIYNSDVRVDGANGSQMTMTAASATLNSGSVLLTNGASLKIGNGSGISAFNISNGVLHTDNDLRVGALNRSVGRLNLAQGRVGVGFEFFVADEVGSTGAVVVTGGIIEATNAAANTRIGQRGNGSLIFSNGLAHFDDVSVGRHDTARGTLLVAGGEFACGTLSIGRFSNAVGMVTVAAASSTSPMAASTWVVKATVLSRTSAAASMHRA